MKIITFECTGILPGVLMDNPALSMKPSGGKDGLTGGRTKILPPDEEAERGTYRMPSGQLCIPAYSFRNSMLFASKGKKFGKAFARQLLGSSVFEVGEERFCPLYVPGTKEPIHTFETDLHRCVIGSAGIMKARALVEEWMCRVSFEYESDWVTREQILQIMQLAGKISGVLSNRPSNPKAFPGSYGRYLVELLPEK